MSTLFRKSFSRKFILGLCLLLLAAGVLVAVVVGPVSVSIRSIFQNALSFEQEAILYHIRLPRVLLTVLVGGALALSGATMQGLFRNPLADPGLVGVSSGAALSVAFLIVMSGTLGWDTGLFGLSFAAFGGGLVTCLVIFRFARLQGNLSVTYMLLAGIAINALAAAGTGFLTYLSNDEQLRTLTFWTMGSLGGTLWEEVIVAAMIVFPVSIVIVSQAQKLNILLLGEREARYLGVNSERLKYILIICTALLVGIAVAVSGIIGFVGLVVPHWIRLLLGPDHRLLMPSSICLGALLLLVSDTIARILVSPAEMPVGILTSLIGGPFFLWLLMKQYAGRFGV